MNEETWKPVVGYEGLYEVSNLGRIKSLNYRSTGRSGILTVSKDDYPAVNLSNAGEVKRHLVHFLVAAAFIGPRPGGAEVNHISGVKSDNLATNLEYLTSSQNKKHSFRIGLHSLKGSRHNNSKLDEAKVKSIRQRVAAGETQRALAAEMKVHPSTICEIVSCKSWTHIGGKAA